ncbi:MAG: potassium channel family protein, partial [Thermodesulfobacteriota bacterium]
MKGSRWFQATRQRLERERVFAIVGALFILIFTSAVCVLIVEHEYADSQIKGFWDAVWWSIVTVATVGYGDLVPKSPVGRVFGAATILGGVVL